MFPLSDPRDMSEPQIIRCTNCGAHNRVPAEKLVQGLKPTCGQCKQPLTGIKPIPVTDATFAEITSSALPVLIDVWAPWCGPCRHLSPIVDELAGELAGKVLVAKLNADENPETAARFDIRNIPALLVINAGKEVDRMVGVRPKAEILRRLTPVMA
jgi:thioredoxin 2